MKRKICSIVAAGLLVALFCTPAALADAENPTLPEAQELLYEVGSDNYSVSAEFVVAPDTDNTLLASTLKYLSYVGAAYPDRVDQDFTFSVGEPMGEQANVVMIQRMTSSGDEALAEGQGVVSIATRSGGYVFTIGGSDNTGLSKAVSAAANPDVLAEAEGSEVLITDAYANWSSTGAQTGAASAPALESFLCFDGSAPVTFSCSNLADPFRSLIATQLAHRAGQQSGCTLDWNVATVSGNISATGPLVYVGTPKELAGMPSEVLESLSVIPASDGSLTVSDEVAASGMTPESSIVFQAAVSPFDANQPAYVIMCPEGYEENLIVFLSNSDFLTQLKGTVAALDLQGNVITAGTAPTREVSRSSSSSQASSTSQSSSSSQASSSSQVSSSSSQASSSSSSQSATESSSAASQSSSATASQSSSQGSSSSSSASGDMFTQMTSQVERQFRVPWWSVLGVALLALLLVVLVIVYIVTGKKKDDDDSPEKKAPAISKDIKDSATSGRQEEVAAPVASKPEASASSEPEVPAAKAVVEEKEAQDAAESDQKEEPDSKVEPKADAKPVASSQEPVVKKDSGFVVKSTGPRVSVIVDPSFELVFDSDKPKPSSVTETKKPEADTPAEAGTDEQKPETEDSDKPLYDPEAEKASEDEYWRALDEFLRFRDKL